MKISYSFGIMDLFHYGHLRALKLADEGADLHVVGLISDSSARAWVGNIVSTEDERRKVLENLKCVDWVMPQETLDPTDNLRKLHHIYSDAEITLFRGDGISIVAAREYLKGIGGKVQSIDYYENLSPSRIMDTLNSHKANTQRQQGIIATKAEVLAALRERLTLSRIEDMYIFSVGEYKAKPGKILSDIYGKYARGGQRIVVRSSSSHEDSCETSNAGHYESVLNVDPADSQGVTDAIERVRKSYLTDSPEDDDEKILVQSQTQNVALSGVVFTREIQGSRPYYVINYDSSGSTDSVTSGGHSSVIYIAHDTDKNNIPEQWRKLFMAVKEIEEVLSRLLLDIEFAITKAGEVVIFQVRPLAANYQYGKSALSDRVLVDKNIARQQYINFHENTGNNILSDMAFWNPAEIIGENPARLDYSLYRDIITFRAWNAGLVPLGYREVPHDLMYRIGNKPYICVEYAFESLIPASLSDSLAEKLKNFYAAKLTKDFSAHDKIEFEIVISCYDFGIDEKLSELRHNHFTDEEISALKNSLHDMTFRAIENYDEILRDDMNALHELERIRRRVEAELPGAKGVSEMMSFAGELINAVRTYGTPQFSRQARLAFIARSLCGSLRDKEIWTADEYNAFMSGIETVATNFRDDFRKFMKGEMSRDDFNANYGHLRAGTYNIRTPRYDAQDLTSGSVQGEEKLTEKNFAGELTIPECGTEREKILRFMKNALEQREYFKFIFTRSLSRAIEIIAEAGEKLGFSRDVMSYFDVHELLGFKSYDTEQDMSDYIREMLPLREKIHEDFSRVIMPEVASSENSFDVVCMTDARPNFITGKKISAECILLDDNNAQNIAGKIIMIEKADPGYDWIFTKNIAGLITKYGGAASHMAIRCAEFGIPAAVGCGEKIFAAVCARKSVVLDCRNRSIK